MHNAQCLHTLMIMHPHAKRFHLPNQTDSKKKIKGLLLDPFWIFQPKFRETFVVQKDSQTSAFMYRRYKNLIPIEKTDSRVISGFILIHPASITRMGIFVRNSVIVLECLAKFQKRINTPFPRNWQINESTTRSNFMGLLLKQRSNTSIVLLTFYSNDLF